MNAFDEYAWRSNCGRIKGGGSHGLVRVNCEQAIVLKEGLPLLLAPQEGCGVRQVDAVVADIVEPHVVDEKEKDVRGRGRCGGGQSRGVHQRILPADTTRAHEGNGSGANLTAKKGGRAAWA